MNWVDALILLFLSVAAVAGWRAGLIRGLAMLAGVVAGSVLAARSYKQVALLFSGFVESEGLRQILAFGLVFLAVLVASLLTGRLISHLLRVLLVGWIDNAAGLAVGAFGGALLVTSLLIAGGSIPVAGIPASIQHSLFGPMLVEQMRAVLALFPQEFDRVKLLLGIG